MKEYRRFIKFLKPHSGLLVLAIVFMAVSSLFDWVSLVMIIPVTDKVLNNGNIIFPFALPGGLTNLISSVNAVPQKNLLEILIVFIPILFLLKGLFNFFYSFYMKNRPALRAGHP